MNATSNAASFTRDVVGNPSSFLTAWFLYVLSLILQRELIKRRRADRWFPYSSLLCPFNSCCRQSGCSPTRCVALADYSPCILRTGLQIGVVRPINIWLSTHAHRYHDYLAPYPIFFTHRPTLRQQTLSDF